MAFIAIDFEASCLPQYGRSFPIEVGIADANGWSRSWLIRPHASWSDWQWSAEAEGLHCITREKLDAEGLDVAEVAARLKSAVQGHDVIADSYFDESWSRALYEAAADPHYLPVRCLAELRAFNDIDNDRLIAALASVDLQRLRRHRAEDDARWLAHLLAELGIDRPTRITTARAA